MLDATETLPLKKASSQGAMSVVIRMLMDKHSEKRIEFGANASEGVLGHGLYEGNVQRKDCYVLATE